jgi:hypothetical protein
MNHQPSKDTVVQTLKKGDVILDVLSHQRKHCPKLGKKTDWYDLFCLNDRGQTFKVQLFTWQLKQIDKSLWKRVVQIRNQTKQIERLATTATIPVDYNHATASIASSTGTGGELEHVQTNEEEIVEEENVEEEEGNTVNNSVPIVEKTIPTIRHNKRKQPAPRGLLDIVSSSPSQPPPVSKKRRECVEDLETSETEIEHLHRSIRHLHNKVHALEKRLEALEENTRAAVMLQENLRSFFSDS